MMRKRRGIALLLTLILLVVCPAAVEAPPGARGDVDGDGLVNAVDALFALQHSVRLVTLDPAGQERADVNGDSAVDAVDALLILQKSVRLLDRFPYIRIPRQSGMLMPVRLSDPPGEDPFAVTAGAAPDPFVTFDNESDYYYGMSTQNSAIVLHRSRVLGDLFTGGETLTVYHTGQEILESLWAPEMAFMDGRWYIYSSGRTTWENAVKHLFVLESEDADPFHGFHFKAYLDNDLFAIDPTVYIDRASGRRYLGFSQVIGGLQWLSVAELITPWQIDAPVPLSDPREYPWEGQTASGPLNEGPFFLPHGGRLFLIYSANGCYDDAYCLGLLEHTGGELTDWANWRKWDRPLFVMDASAGIYGPGHASFFLSPDRSEWWIAYHCYYSPNPDRARRMRVCHVQPIAFDPDGFPDLGTPLPGGALVGVPSGE